MRIGIIGGSGLYSMFEESALSEMAVNTRFGEPSDKYIHIKHEEHELFFLNRHGRNHTYAPHTINYLANIDGFKTLGVELIISFSATGGMKKGFNPGDIVIPDNAADMTKSRKSSFFDKDEIFHVDMTEPFCATARKAVINAAHYAGVNVHEYGTSICTEGPRLETAAEIKMFKLLGADLVGMTLFPEVTLAREAGICYVNISTITNYAAGISITKLTSDEIVEIMGQTTSKLKAILYEFLDKTPDLTSCRCKDSLAGTKISKK